MREIFRLVLLLSWVWNAAAAPIEPEGSVDVTGVIESAEWVAEKKVSGKRGYSGSLGRDRVFPPHFRVVLRDFTGPDAARSQRLNHLVGATALNPGEGEGKPRMLEVWINADDRRLLRSGMRIRLGSYRLSGDEGGTWAHHDAPVILKE